jgi:hypothetical protein
MSVPALTGRYEFLSFREPAQGRAWLEAIREKVPSAKAVANNINLERRWVSVAFTWNGLRAVGMDEASLATFPEEFRQGMYGRFSATPARTIRTIGSAAWRARNFTRLPFSLPEMPPTESVVFVSTGHFWHVRPA